jgi:uncharacterized protein YpuA (DUF1002 family)
MTDQTLDDMAGDDPGTNAGEDPRVEVLQAVVDRVVSWQEGTDPATVRTELDDALSRAGVDVDEATKQRIVERVSGETPHFDVREVL